MQQNYTLKCTLCALMLLSLTSLTWAWDFRKDGIYYNMISDTEVEVTYREYKYSGDYTGDIAIPSTVTLNAKTFNVTSIGESAFKNCTSLTSISLPKSIKSIGDWAFDGCYITSITLPDNLTHIGQYAFTECYYLTSITLPESLTHIGSGAFHYCSSLTSITIPKNVINIGQPVFFGCSSLKSIEVAEANPKYDSREGCNAIIETETNTLIRGLSNTIIPESVTCIGEDAFAFCSYLKSVFIHKNITNIGRDAFYGISLTSITVADENPKYDSREGCNAIIETETNTLIIGCQNTNIPEGVTSIGERAFLDCTSLTSISIPEGVTNIGESAFDACTSLTSISLPEGVTSIGKYVFCNCISLTSVTVPESVTSIGEEAFLYCSSLTSITIPKKVANIEYAAFSGCRSLTELTSLAKTPPVCGSDAFYNVNKLCTLHVPEGCAEAYKQADEWKDFYNIIDDAEEFITAIETIGADTEAVSPTYYTIDGKRVDAPTQKGIYIKNGKKIIIK